MTIDKYVALANEFAGSKDDALVGEAGGCAIYLFAESCHLHHGDSFWVMEANKLWRACVKKAKARRRSSAQRGGCGDESFLAEELRKAAHRLVPPDVFGGGRTSANSRLRAPLARTGATAAAAAMRPTTNGQRVNRPTAMR